jgi:chromosome partitioning protein
MKVISLINSKGGVGKTTLAINLSAYLYNCMSRDIDKRILLVDADPQGSVRDWKEAQKQDSKFDVIEKKYTIGCAKHKPSGRL